MEYTTGKTVLQSMNFVPLCSSAYFTRNKKNNMKKKYNSYPFIENLNDDFNYIQLKEQLSDGAIDLIIKAKDGTNVNVYSAGLWHILISDEFANEGFIDAYTKGFRNGKNFIEEKTNKALNGFYKSCSDEYINELRHAYFFKSDNYILGYKNGAYGVPTMFYIDNIESIGFASGVVCAIDLMAKESPFLFAGFYDIETNEPQQNQTDEVTSFTKNNFDHVPPKKVYDYFKKELVDTGYLSLEDLEKYLIVAFQDKTVPAERFTITYNRSSTPTKIKKIFYKYYEKIAQDKHGKMKYYCGLLGEYFNGFNTDKISRNFNK